MKKTIIYFLVLFAMLLSTGPVGAVDVVNKFFIGENGTRVPGDNFIVGKKMVLLTNGTTKLTTYWDTDYNGFYYVEGNVSLGEVKIDDTTKEINIVLGPNASLTIEKLVIYTCRKDNRYILNVYRECPETGEFSSEGSFTIDELKHYHTDAGSVIISYTPELHVYGGIVSVGSFTNYHYYTASSSPDVEVYLGTDNINVWSNKTSFSSPKTATASYVGEYTQIGGNKVYGAVPAPHVKLDLTGLLGLSGTDTPDMIESVTIDGSAVSLSTLKGSAGLEVTAAAHEIAMTFKGAFQRTCATIDVYNGSTKVQEGVSGTINLTCDAGNTYTIKVAGYEPHEFKFDDAVTAGTSETNRKTYNYVGSAVTPPYSADGYLLYDVTTSNTIQQSLLSSYFTVSGTTSSSTAGDYDITYTPKAGSPYYGEDAVTYYWTLLVVPVAQIGETPYSTLKAAVEAATDGQTITLLTDVTLSEDIVCPLTAGSLTITFGEYSITKGGYSVSLATGVTVTTDKQTDIFTAASGDIIVETSVGTGYKYSAQTLVANVDQPQNLSSFVVTATAPYVASGYGASNAESGAAIKAATTIVIKDGNGTVWTNYEGFEVTIDNDPTAANNYNNTGTYTGVVHVAVKPDYASNFTGAVPAGDLTIGTGTDIISSLVVNTIDAMYTAGKLPPSENTLEVKLGSQVLTYGTDFDIIVNGEESDYVDAKTYHNAVIIKGKGAYYGSFIADYTIRPRSLGDEYIEVKATNLDYTGDDQDVTVVVKYKKNDVENVIPEDNYTFTPTTANEAGKYVITVNAVDNSNLLGSTTTDLWVFKSMETYADDFIVEPDPIPTQTATGSEIKPEVVVKDNNRTLVFGEDYNVTYSHNIDPGEATITITGMYAYSGTITRHFTIVPEYFVVDEITYHHALAGEEVTVGKKGDDGNVLATTLTGDVTVPATIHYSDKDFTVVGIEENAFSGDAIYTLTLPESIETIANKSFSNCSNLRWLDLTAMVGYTPSTLDRISDRGPFSKVPKQTLVFLEGTTTSGENYIYKYGDNDFRCDVLKIYEDLKGDQTGYNQANGYKWGFLNPYEFKANTVTNTRQLNATNTENKQQGYTICLPYALPVPNGVSAYTLMASNNDLLGFEPVDGNTLAALTPYVLIPIATGQLLSTTDATIVKTTDADLAATAVRSAAADGQKTYTMYGSMTYMDDVTGAYIMQSGNVWKQIETAGSYDGATNKACILPMRAYIKPDSSPAPVLYSVFGASGTTGMDIFRHISLDAEDGQLYDLQGRPVTTPTRGVYIRNGKKVVIK